MRQAHGRRTVRIRIFNKKRTGNTYNINSVGVMNFGDNCAINHYYDKDGKWVRTDVKVGSHEQPPAESHEQPLADLREVEPLKKEVEPLKEEVEPTNEEVEPLNEDTPPSKEERTKREEVPKSDGAEQALSGVQEPVPSSVEQAMAAAEQASSDVQEPESPSEERASVEAEQASSGVLKQPPAESQEQPPADSREVEPSKKEVELANEEVEPLNEDTPPSKEERTKREEVPKSDGMKQASSEVQQPESPREERASAAAKQTSSDVQEPVPRSEERDMAAAELRLGRYIRDGDRRTKLMEILSYVLTAHDFAFMAVASLHDLPNVTRETVVRGEFIRTLLPFAPLLTKGRTVSNIRVHINRMLTCNKSDWRRPPRIP